MVQFKEQAFRTQGSFWDFLRHQSASPDEAGVPPRLREILAGLDFKTETHTNIAIGSSIAIAMSGEKFQGRLPILREAHQDYLYSPDAPTDLTLAEYFHKYDVTRTSGFTTLYKMPVDLTLEEHLFIQEELISALVEQVCRQLAKQPSDIDLFIFTTTLPLKGDVANDIAARVGIDQRVAIIPISQACNSTGEAKRLVLTGEYDHLIAERIPTFATDGLATVCVASLDHPNARRNQGGDPKSPQLFGDAAGVELFHYAPSTSNRHNESSYQVLTALHQDHPRVAKWLKVPRDWETAHWVRPPHAIYADHLVTPDHGKVVELHERAGVYFILDALAIATDTMTEYASKLGVTVPEAAATIKTAIIHHPNQRLFEALGGKLQEQLGFVAEQLPWEIFEGNFPVVTHPVALGRQLTNLQPGDRVMFLTFGAGGEYTCSIVELGETDRTIQGQMIQSLVASLTS